MSAYHDEEWGRPIFDDRRLFEKICLEGFQAGLSWITILRKRERFREVFDGFDPARVARYGARDVARLLKDPGIVRHRGKIASTINNARRMLELGDEFGSLAAYAWSVGAGGRRSADDADLGGPAGDADDAGLGGTVEGPEASAAGRSSVRRPSTRSCRRWAW